MNDTKILSANNSFYSNFYPAPLYSPSRDFSSNSNKDLININTNQNKDNTIRKIPFVFQIPKQSSNFHLTRTPPPLQNRKNIIDLKDNRIFRESSNSPVVYRKINSMSSINNLVQINATPVRRISQPTNVGTSNMKPIYNSPPGCISIDQKIQRLARTPEPRKKYLDNSNNINVFFNNNNNSTYNINNGQLIPNNIQNKPQMKIDHTRIISQIPHINYSRNDFLKPHNSDANIRKFNDYFQNNNNNLNIIIKKANDYNQFNQNNKDNIINYNQNNNNENMNMINNKKIIFLRKNNDYENKNNFNIRKNEINQTNNLIIKKSGESNFRNYLNKINNSNIKRNNDLNQNINYFNGINININNNLNIYNNNININLNQANNFSNNYPNNINIKKMVGNNSNSSLNNSYNLQKVPNNDFSNHYYNSYKNLPNINLIQNIQNIPPNIEQNRINIIPIPQNKLFQFNGNGIIRRSFKEIDMSYLVPRDYFNLSEFKIIRQIGEGTYGIIYCVKWIKNNQLYALKKIGLYGEELDSFQKKVKIIQNLINKTKHNGIIKLYGDTCVPQKKIKEYIYYIIMELGEKDWEQEMNTRKTFSLYYSEKELINIIKQLVKTLALMQKNNITHRDIKPQNIILCKNVFKICDFDEAKELAEMEQLYNL